MEKARVRIIPHTTHESKERKQRGFWALKGGGVMRRRSLIEEEGVCGEVKSVRAETQIR